MTYPPLLIIIPWALSRRGNTEQRRDEAASKKKDRRPRPPCRGPRTLGGFAGFRDDEPEPAT